MWPPSSGCARLARTTIASAFQRTSAEMRASISRLPGNCGCSASAIVFAYGVFSTGGSGTRRARAWSSSLRRRKVARSAAFGFAPARRRPRAIRGSRRGRRPGDSRARTRRRRYRRGRSSSHGNPRAKQIGYQPSGYQAVAQLFRAMPGRGIGANICGAGCVSSRRICRPFIAASGAALVVAVQSHFLILRARLCRARIRRGIS